MCGQDDDPSQHDRPRTFAFEGRPDRTTVLDTIRAALEDEGLRLEQGSWGRVGIAIDGRGQLVASVPLRAISRSTT